VVSETPREEPMEKSLKRIQVAIPLAVVIRAITFFGAQFVKK
jgi:hypothetical protein